MPESSSAVRLDEFRARPLQWIVVHHLLTADLLRELVSAIIDTSTEGRLTLEGLFEDAPPVGPSATSSWFVAARKTESAFADFLSRLVTSMVWRGDDAPSPPHDGLDARETEWVRALTGAFDLAWTDLSSALDVDDAKLPQSLRAVAAAFSAAQRATADEGDSGLPGDVAAATDGSSSLLDALLTKHIGDLHADLDRWDLALSYYSRAETLLSDETGWEEAARTTRDVVAQSIAMAMWHIKGPEAAALVLEALVERSGIEVAPLPTLNATFDLMNARMARGSFSTAWSDRRSADYFAPLLVHSHHLDNAMTYTSLGRYRQAHRWFWATLRRQTALGGTVASWVTKGHYGRSIIDELQATLGQQNRPGAFALGVRLLVESGRTELIEKTTWSERIVETYVNDDVLDDLSAIVKRSPGTVTERSLAATALRREWLLTLPSDREGVARRMLADLLVSARVGPHTGMSSTNTGGLALKSLKSVGTERPEFRALVGRELVQLLDGILAGHGVLTVSEAVETAAEFVDGIEAEFAKALCMATMGLVERLPANAAWPMTHAASRLLGSHAAARLARADAVFGRDRSIALVKLALNSAQEHTGLLYLLRDVDPSVVSGQIDANGLTAIVNGIREAALEASSSAATGNIHALLVAPKVVGASGIADALRGMERILRSASSKRASPSLQNGYEVLLLLARHGDEIEADLGESWSFTDHARALLEPLCEMWSIAASKPLIFAGFAIPPLSVPNRVAVHNWTFATLEFAKWLDASAVVGPALQAASANQDLVEGMSVARAMQGTAAAAIDAGDIAAERTDAFYAALGERLAGIGPRADDDAATDLRVLLDRCMDLGPRGEDAALLLASRRLHVLLDPDDAKVAAYTAKLRKDPKLRLSLSPLLRYALAAPG